MDDPFTDPVGMTPQQRRSEIAALLARGVLRLREVSHRSSNSRPYHIVNAPASPVRSALMTGRKQALMRWPGSHGHRPEELAP